MNRAHCLVRHHNTISGQMFELETLPWVYAAIEIALSAYNLDIHDVMMEEHLKVIIFAFHYD